MSYAYPNVKNTCPEKNSLKTVIFFEIFDEKVFRNNQNLRGEKTRKF